MARVLVVEDSAVQARHVEVLLRTNGHAVTLAADGAAGLAAVRAAVPDLVLTDMHMPGMSGLELIQALKADFPGLPVVMMTHKGSEDVAVAALRAGATGYVPKRRLEEEIVPLMDELLALAAVHRKQQLLLDRMTAAEHRFVLDNDPDLVPNVVGHVESLLRQMGLFDESDRMRIGVAVHEAVVNAIVHGNLEISSDLKSGDWDDYHQAIASRRAAPPYMSRRVYLLVRVSREPYLEVRARDEGPGFDPKKLPDPTDPANLEKGCGRGLLLIRTFFDEVSHSPAGNEIVMIKRR